MPSLSAAEKEFVDECIGKVAKAKPVRAACLYGSRVAGYSRADSDIDVLVVLERYAYTLKYAYFKGRAADVSALVVDAGALLKDAAGAFLGEFVAGRLLHIYEPLQGASFLHDVERTYKKRVILEELSDIVAAAGVLGTEVTFPLAYIHFSKIKKRVAQYPGAAFSYYKTYSPSIGAKNLEFSLGAYARALEEIVSQDPELFSLAAPDSLQLSRTRVAVVEGQARLRLARRLSLPISSFVVHTYAGRKLLHMMVSEAESKIRRRLHEPRLIPPFIANPRSEFWKLPEGELIVSSGDWTSEFAKRKGMGDGYSLARRRLGDVNSRTVLCTLRAGQSERKVVVKWYAGRKSIKWAALSVWSSPVRTFRVDALLRMGSEYIAHRHLRQLGLLSPLIEAVVLDKRLLVTAFIEGKTLADNIRSFLVEDRADSEPVEIAATQIAKVHENGCSFGNIKPKNIIVSGSESRPEIYFTDLEQFAIDGGDQSWDIAQFICWGLKYTSSAEAASHLVRRFLDGYMRSKGNVDNIRKLSKSRRYVESFYPILMPQVARAIKGEIKAAMT